MYLTDTATVTGHILYVDGGAHFGRWYMQGVFVMTSDTTTAGGRLRAVQQSSWKSSSQ